MTPKIDTLPQLSEIQRAPGASNCRKILIVAAAIFAAIAITLTGSLLLSMPVAAAVGFGLGISTIALLFYSIFRVRDKARAVEESAHLLALHVQEVHESLSTLSSPRSTSDSGNLPPSYSVVMPSSPKQEIGDIDSPKFSDEELGKALLETEFVDLSKKEIEEEMKQQQVQKPVLKPSARQLAVEKTQQTARNLGTIKEEQPSVGQLMLQLTEKQRKELRAEQNELFDDWDDVKDSIDNYKTLLGSYEYRSKLGVEVAYQVKQEDVLATQSKLAKQQLELDKLEIRLRSAIESKLKKAAAKQS